MEALEWTTPLHVAKTAEVANLLLNAGAQINKQTKDGFSALHLAANVGDTDVTKVTP